MTPLEELVLVRTLLRSGKNVILSCPGGVGKTTLISRVADLFLLEKKKLVKTAMTGVAALALGGGTLHSALGLGIRKWTVPEYVASCRKACWDPPEMLIIDEVSMLGRELFEMIEESFRVIRRSDAPFGGTQLLLSGDFLQLPPVNDDWIFESPKFERLKLVSVGLIAPRRYLSLTDADAKERGLAFFEMLLRIRDGIPSDEDITKLEARRRAFVSKDGISIEVSPGVTLKPTFLSSRRIDVDNINSNELDKLSGPGTVFLAEDKYVKLHSDSKLDTLTSMLETAIPAKITLKKGAQIMLRRNVNPGAGLVNGTRGVVVDIDTSLSPPLIITAMMLPNGSLRRWIVPTLTWEVENKNAGRASRKQIPLILAFSTTIHKSQGLTMNYVIADLGPSVFAPGQAYVALSRVRSLEGLFLADFRSTSISADPLALEASRAYAETAITEVKFTLD